MYVTAEAHEHLRAYLRSLGPPIQAALLTQIERAVLGGESVPDAEIILTELRSVIRNSPQKADRVGSPSRIFFEPIDPFVVDGIPNRVVRGHIARESLNSIWVWINRDLLPKESMSYSESVKRALVVSAMSSAVARARDFQDLMVKTAGELLTSDARWERAREQLSAHMGPPRAMTDLREVITVLQARDALAAVARELPIGIAYLADHDLAVVRHILDEKRDALGNAFIYALVLVMRRLTMRWQLIRLAAPAAPDNPGATPPDRAAAHYRLAVILVLADIEEMVSRLRVLLEVSPSDEIEPLIHAIGGSVRGLAAELAGTGNEWALQKLAAIRTDVRALLTMGIKAIPEHIDRLLTIPAAAAANGGTLDANEIAEREREIALLAMLRPYAAALGLGRAVAWVRAKIRSDIERAVGALLAGLRSAADYARKMYLLQIRFVVGVCNRLFGSQAATAIVCATKAVVGRKPDAG